MCITKRYQLVVIMKSPFAIKHFIHFLYGFVILWSVWTQDMNTALDEYVNLYRKLNGGTGQPADISEWVAVIKELEAVLEVWRIYLCIYDEFMNTNVHTKVYIYIPHIYEQAENRVSIPEAIHYSFRLRDIETESTEVVV